VFWLGLALEQAGWWTVIFLL